MRNIFFYFAATDSVKILRVNNLEFTDTVKRCAAHYEEVYRIFEKFGGSDEVISPHVQKNFFSLQEAMAKAEETLNGKIIGVFDGGDRWIFNFDFEVDACMSVKFCCMKVGGELETFPYNEPALGKRTVRISLPQ